MLKTFQIFLTGELAQQSRSLTALPEDLGLSPMVHWNSARRLYNSMVTSITPVPGNLMPSSGLPGYQTCTQYIGVLEHAHIHKIIIMFQILEHL